MDKHVMGLDGSDIKKARIKKETSGTHLPVNTGGNKAISSPQTTKEQKTTTAKDNKSTKGTDEIYCHSCGAVIKQEAVMCVSCGVPVRGAFKSPPKDKTVAVLLAVFLGFWTWCYSYKKDAWKFWVNLGLSVVTLGVWAFFAWIWAIIDVSIRPAEFYSNFD